MSYSSFSEAFADGNGRPYAYRADDTGNMPVPAIGNPRLVDQNQGQFNMVANLTNPNNNILQRSLPNASKQDLERSINNIIGTPGVNYGPELTIQSNKTYPSVKANYDNEIAAKTKMCEAVKTAGGNPFAGNAAFSASCGVCVKGGTDSTGKGHVGGMLILENDRQAAVNDARAKGLRYPHFAPTIGTCEPGYFAADEQGLTRTRNRVSCEDGQNFGLPGCVQNYDTSKFFYVDDVTYEPPTLVFAGSGILTLTYSQRQANGWTAPKKVAETALSEAWKEITLPVQTHNQSALFKVAVTPPAGADLSDPTTANALYVAIALRGPTHKGMFVKDMGSVLAIDNASGKPPRIRGTITYKGKRITAVKASKGALIDLPFSIPISFLNPALPDTKTGAPSSGVISSAEDATLLNSGACFAKGSGPGAFSKECITQMFESSGCTDQGQLHPSRNNELVTKVNTDKMDLDTAVSYMSGLYKRGLTGSDESGGALSVSAWNDASMKCLGRKIGGACDGPNAATGPLPNDCLQALYENKGGSVSGTTYTTGVKNASLADRTDQFCTPQGTEAPIGPDGKVRQDVVDRLRRLGGVEAVKKHFDSLHRNALDNTLTNEDRDKYMMGCYGKRTAAAGGEVGTRARFVRILRAPDVGNDPQCLMIQQLQVFDTQGVNVAPAGKAMMNKPNGNMPASNAITQGNGRPAHDSCQPGAADSYFELDMGKEVDVAFITYLNAAWGQSRAKGMKLQLLDTGRKVITERVFGLDYIRTFRFLKAPESGANDIPYLIKQGMSVMLSNLRGRDNKRFYISTSPFPATGYLQCQPTTIPDYLIIGPPNIPMGRNADSQKAYISLRSPNGQFIRHSNFVISASQYEDNDVFRADSTFEIIYPGIQSKSPNTISFRSVNFPNRYIAVRDPTNINAEYPYVLAEASSGVNVDFVIEPATIDMSKLPLEVYNYYSKVDQFYGQDKWVADYRCKSLGGRLASSTEVRNAQKNGAAWCSSGWTGDEKTMWPMQSIATGEWGCGKPYDVNEWRPDSQKVNATCYGPKPPMSGTLGRAMSFQETLYPGWSGKNPVKGLYSQGDK